MESHQSKESYNPFATGLKKMNSNKTLTKDIVEEMEFDPLELMPERTIRSQSHFIFQFRPEHVPKPKPKKTSVQPTPMILCLKSIQEIENPPFYLKNPNDPYLSCPNSDSDSSNEVSTEEAEIIQSNKCNISSQRRQMNRIRSKTLVDDNNKAKDCDAIEEKERKSLDRVMDENDSSNRISALFSDTIKSIIQKEKEKCKRMTIGPSILPQSGLSLLKILEVSAEKVTKKVNNNEYMKNYSLIQSRMKRSSTIV